MPNQSTTASSFSIGSLGTYNENTEPYFPSDGVSSSSRTADGSSSAKHASSAGEALHQLPPSATRGASGKTANSSSSGGGGFFSKLRANGARSTPPPPSAASSHHHQNNAYNSHSLTPGSSYPPSGNHSLHATPQKGPRKGGADQQHRISAEEIFGNLPPITSSGAEGEGGLLSRIGSAQNLKDGSSKKKEATQSSSAIQHSRTGSNTVNTNASSTSLGEGHSHNKSRTASTSIVSGHMGHGGGVNANYIDLSSTRVFFPRVGEVVTVVNSSNVTEGGGRSASSVPVPVGEVNTLPTTFTASDVENIIHLRATLGTSWGLVSSTVVGTAPLLPTTVATASASAGGVGGGSKSKAPPHMIGISTRSLSEHLLGSHPLLLYKVRSSAAAAFNCAPCYGLLQRYPGDTVNALSPEEAVMMGGGIDFAGSLAAIIRASERLSVSVRSPSAHIVLGGGDGNGADRGSRSLSPTKNAAEEGGGGGRGGALSRSPSSANAIVVTTRDIEKLRIEFVAVLDTPTQQDVKNILRTYLAPFEARGAPPSPSASNADSLSARLLGGSVPREGEEGDAASLLANARGGSAVVMPMRGVNSCMMLKYVQPVLAELYEELKEKAPEEDRVGTGDGNSARPSDPQSRAAAAMWRRRRTASAAARSGRRSSFIACDEDGGDAPPSTAPLPLLPPITAPLLSFCNDLVMSQHSEGQGGGESSSSVVVRLGHVDVTCFMDCGPELASYFSPDGKHTQSYMHWKQKGTLASPLSGSDTTSPLVSFDGGDGKSQRPPTPPANDEAQLFAAMGFGPDYELRYIRAGDVGGTVDSAGGGGGAGDHTAEKSNARHLATVIHPLPIPPYANIQLKNRLPHRHHSSKNRKTSNARQQSQGAANIGEAVPNQNQRQRGRGPLSPDELATPNGQLGGEGRPQSPTNKSNSIGIDSTLQKSEEALAPSPRSPTPSSFLAKLCAQKVPCVVVVPLIAITYAFVYCWRHLAEGKGDLL